MDVAPGEAGSRFNVVRVEHVAHFDDKEHAAFLAVLLTERRRVVPKLETRHRLAADAHVLAVTAVAAFHPSRAPMRLSSGPPVRHTAAKSLR